MAKGYALMDDRGELFLDTISSTERATKVDALVSLYKTPVFQQDSDAKINQMFDQRHWKKHKIVAVNIQPVELI